MRMKPSRQKVSMTENCILVEARRRRQPDGEVEEKRRGVGKMREDGGWSSG